MFHLPLQLVQFCSHFHLWVYRAVYWLLVVAVVVDTTMRAVLAVGLLLAKVQVIVVVEIVRALVVRKLTATHLALVAQQVVRTRVAVVVVIGVVGVRGKRRS
jgi:hypothetical protein